MPFFSSKHIDYSKSRGLKLILELVAAHRLLGWVVQKIWAHFKSSYLLNYEW